MNKLTPLARQEYVKLVDELEKKSIEKQLAYGEAVNYGDGDGWHDETVAYLEREKLTAQSEYFRAEQILKRASLLQQPTQFDRVELGHRVRVILLDDDDVAHPCFVTVLPSINLTVLSRFFDGYHEILVSDKSPLGKALLGQSLGETVIYNGMRAVIEDIVLSKMF